MNSKYVLISIVFLFIFGLSGCSNQQEKSTNKSISINIKNEVNSNKSNEKNVISKDENINISKNSETKNEKNISVNNLEVTSNTDKQNIDIKNIQTQEKNTLKNLGFLYKNNTYGFSLFLPISWKGYKATEDTKNNTLCFFVPEANSQNFCIFQLYLIKKNKPVSNQLRIIGTTTNWQASIDKELLCTQLSNTQCKRQKEVEKIIKSFKSI